MIGKPLTLEQLGKNAKLSTEGQILRYNHSLHPVEGSAYGSIVEQATTVVQSQRARICEQAEEHLQAVISLYDVGVSLDILDADPRLRTLLVNASKSFGAKRSIESQGFDSDDFVGSR